MASVSAPSHPSAISKKIPKWFTSDETLVSKDNLVNGQRYLKVTIRAEIKGHDGYCSDFDEQSCDHVIRVKIITKFLPFPHIVSDFDWEKTAVWKVKSECSGSTKSGLCKMWDVYKVIDFVIITATQPPIPWEMSWD